MKQILRLSFISLVFIISRFHASAEEGMWLPQLLQSLNEKEMKKLGMKISASDIYSINKGSLKDAVVSLGGFCTAEVISDKGLMLTNHHCGFDAIQTHTSLEKNYIRDGFWAKNFNEELTNPGLTATFIIRIEEITDIVMKNITSSMTERERQSAIDKNIVALRPTITKESYQDLIIRPLFEGNKYFVFVTETYKDIRLVGAPPSAIGNFGKDTDNWMWPRHTGDFSMFRIYADKDNKPAAYAEDNVPYKPRRSLSISLDGVNEGDFTMVFGFPGRTMQYLHSSAVAMTMNVNDPAKIGIRDEALTIIGGYMRQDERVKIQYASKYAGIENSHKKWKGEVLGLKSTNAVEKKKILEAEFTRRLSTNPLWMKEYGTLLSDLEKTYTEISPYGFARDYYTETLNVIELMDVANIINTLATTFENNGESKFNEDKLQTQESLKALFKDYSMEIDRKLFETLIAKYVKDQEGRNVSPMINDLLVMQNNDFSKLADQVYRDSRFTNAAGIESLLKLNGTEFSEASKNDIATRILLDMRKTYSTNVGRSLGEIQSRLNQLQRNYVKAQMEVFKEKNFYPDANSTLRLTYGQVKGYRPRDGVAYGFYTYLDGIMEKYKPGDYEFDVPRKLVELYEKKDFGQYGENGKQPVCFIGTNHTTGGNSGSPALDAYGNLVGLNFDRVWEGTMSDINYDPALCRNIMVDIRYVLFIVDKFAGAKNLVSEMKLVHPKKK